MSRSAALVWLLLAAPAFADEVPAVAPEHLAMHDPAPTKTLSLTDEEIKATIALVDMAVKAQGLKVAGPAAVVAGKLQQSLQAGAAAAP